MIARLWEPEKDFEQIASWGEKHGAKYSREQFPATGFIVDGLAAYFLYKTDSSCCWLENLISNKDADPKEREKAIELVCETVLLQAKRLGFKLAYATTHNFSVIKRALLFGAKAERQVQVLLTKDLEAHR